MKKNAVYRRHAAMIEDPRRTPLLYQAIRKIVQPGDKVLDLGCGLGLLSFEAIRAGAHTVYACDVDTEALQAAQKEARRLGFAHQIAFFNNFSSDIFLMEKIDLIIAETVGSLGLDENIVPSVIDARERFLKKGGKIIPQKISVWGAIVARGSRELLAKPQKYFEVDLLKIKKIVFDKSIRHTINQDGQLGGLLVWFEVVWAPGIVTNTSPESPATHWKQGFLAIKKKLQLKKGNELYCRLRIVQDPVDSTRSVIEWGHNL